MFYNARYYSPYLNRWLQPDSIVPEPGNPQALNRYSYVYNSPLNYTDPSGHAATCPDCGGVSLEKTLDYFRRYGKHGALFNDYYASVYAGEQALAEYISGGITQAEARVLAAHEGSSATEHLKAINALSQSDFDKGMLVRPTTSLLGRAMGMGFAIFPEVSREEWERGIQTGITLGAYVFAEGFSAQEQIAVQNSVALTGRNFSAITFWRGYGAPSSYIAQGTLGEPHITIHDGFFSLSVDQQAAILNEELNHTLQSASGGLGRDDIIPYEDDARTP
jgi:hypothetical protein